MRYVYNDQCQILLFNFDLLHNVRSGCIFPILPLCVSCSTYRESLSNNQELVEFVTDHFPYFMTLMFDSDAYHCQGSKGERLTRGRK